MTLAAATGEGLPEGGAVVGAWFDGQKHDRAGLADGALTVAAGDADEPAALAAARAWLECYFAGEDPGPIPALAPTGTAFQQGVWARLRTIPRGQTTTYGRIAADLAAATAAPPPPAPSAPPSAATRSASSCPATACSAPTAP
ncbi:methylated-DNA--[protein]-cysteine S-methyltransferase [Actinomyces procaprae]|uniref:methylated-DNA--[protein]-cysteine S-methyltransferase n=1 Tax=Actinomyces procaprae TaxID=2560010 RepID=UPI0030840131